MTAAPTPVRRTPFSSSMTWTADTLLVDDGLLKLTPDVIEEMKGLASDPNFHSPEIRHLHPDSVYLPACRDLMEQVHRRLDVETGFAIIDRLPLDELGNENATRVYWLLMNMMGQAVAQKWDGTIVYDVTDTRQSTEAGNGVRSSKTREGQNYHIDNAFNLPPDYVGLLCLQTAASGGVSGLISFETLYNKLLEERPDALERLHQPFWFDRQLEHAEHESRVSFKPMIENRGDSVAFNFNRRLVEQGYAVKGEPIDDDTRNALDALRDVSESEGMGKAFEFERGQIQIVNNRRLGHRRTAYTDHSDDARRRHLVRIWVRNHGSASYAG